MLIQRDSQFWQKIYATIGISLLTIKDNFVFKPFSEKHELTDKDVSSTMDLCGSVGKAMRLLMSGQAPSNGFEITLTNIEEYELFKSVITRFHKEFFRKKININGKNKSYFELPGKQKSDYIVFHFSES